MSVRVQIAARASVAERGKSVVPQPIHIYPTYTHLVHVPKARVDERGRVSIPASLREEIGLGAQDEVLIEREGGTLLLRKVSPEIPTVNSRGGWKRLPFPSSKEALFGS